MWFLLLLINCLKFEHIKSASLGPGRIPYTIPISKIPQNENQMVVLSVPEGFNPPKPPIGPQLLYPFETGMVTQETYSDWRPIIPRKWLKPAMENEKVPKVKVHSNHRYESVAFGPWQPVSPLLMEQLPTELKDIDKTDYENVTPAQNRNYVLIGGRGRTKNRTMNYPKTTLFNQTIGLQLNKKNINEITTVTESQKKNILLPSPSPPKAKATPKLSNNVWPKDFIEKINTSKKEDLMRDLNENDDDLLNEVPLNITRLGVPFENRDSTDKASICVPLTVQAQKSATDIVEIDRVYCFPLPAAPENSNDTISHEPISNVTDRPILKEKIESMDSAAEILKLKYFTLFISLFSIITVF